MVDDTDDRSAVSTGILGGVSRRQILSAAAFITVAGGATSLVGGQEDEQEDPTEDDGASEIELPREYHAHLLGEPHDVETDASGEARFQVNEDGTEAAYEVTVENICNVTQAHIHLGAEGEDGPVVVWLYPEEGMELELIEGSFSGTLAEGTITEDEFVGEWEGVDFEDAIAIFEEEGAYVNVHTEEHPGGEIRGQILPPHE